MHSLMGCILTFAKVVPTEGRKLQHIMSKSGDDQIGKWWTLFAAFIIIIHKSRFKLYWPLLKDHKNVIGFLSSLQLAVTKAVTDILRHFIFGKCDKCFNILDVEINFYYRADRLSLSMDDSWPSSCFCLDLVKYSHLEAREALEHMLQKL